MAFFAAALATIFSVIDPVGLAPLFLGLTAEMSGPQRIATIHRAVLIAALILLIFAIAGRVMLHALGISVPAFSIAGGILLLLIAIDMLFARTSSTKETPAERAAALQSADISVFPLAIPIVSGPGAIATVILYMSYANGSPVKVAAVLAAIAISLAASYVSMRLSGLLLLLLGETGVHVVGRLMGILLAALAIQFVLNGVATYWHHTLAL
ncbi:MAG TPA: MarC family protein [Chloroflexota bacterium]|nr:MarC family protein [Chloroflexota bacterium]